MNEITSSSSTPCKFSVGTLRYSASGLAGLFAWLLWGDFCFQLMEMVIHQVLPLKLQSLNASNTLVGIIITTIPSVMSLTVGPIASFRSDRFRSRWGRRIPFLLFATPPLSLFLILLGCSDALGGWLHRSLSLLSNVAPTAVVLGLVALSVTGFQLFNVIAYSIYYYLFNDVVPEAVMGRFLGLFRVVAAGAAALFMFLVFKYAQTHTREIFVGAASLYFVAFTIMCLNVKEGRYPPPAENIEGKKGIIAATRTYFSESFKHRFYWNYFLSQLCYSIAGCTSPFMVFLYLSVHIDLAKIGVVMGFMQIIGILLGYPSGVLSDRVNPVRVMMVSTGLLVVSSASGLIWLFINPSPAVAVGIYATYMTLFSIIIAAYGAADVPMSMQILPRDRYGQFASANGMIRSIAVILMAPVLGSLLDVMKRYHHGDSYYYRYAPIWMVIFHGLSLFFMCRVYRYWKLHGGATSFKPPGATAPTEFEAALQSDAQVSVQDEGPVSVGSA